MSVLEIAQRLLLGVVVLAPTMALAWPTGPPDDGAPPGRRFPGGPGGGPGDEQPRFPGPPIMAALDSDRDGELSVEEIRNAVAALKSLDRNHDGILDRSELEPRDAGPGGPDGPPDGPHGGGRLGGPPAGGPDGPPGGGPPAGAGRGRPAMGHVLPPFVRDDLSLSDRQQKQIAELEKDVKGKLESILTARQLRQARSSWSAVPAALAVAVPVVGGALARIDLGAAGLPPTQMTDRPSVLSAPGTSDDLRPYRTVLGPDCRSARKPVASCCCDPRILRSIPTQTARVTPAMPERQIQPNRMWVAALVVAGAWAAGLRADEPRGEKTIAKPPQPAVLASAAGLWPIGGRWYVREGNLPTYVFKDADAYVDLFSYHVADSNNDGIPNLKVRHDAEALIIDSQGYPNHPTAIFPNSRNPNRIRVQDFHFRLPLDPKRARSITRVPMGPIGMALDGVVFFNPFEAGGMNAIEGYSEVCLDSCCGHPQQHGLYHYHKYPSCVKSPFADDGRRHSPVLGFAFDGFPLHGPYEEAGVLARDLKGDRALDVCNGHDDPAEDRTGSLRGDSWSRIG